MLPQGQQFERNGAVEKIKKVERFVNSKEKQAGF